MIYKFPTNRTIDSAFKGELGSSLESYLDNNLPSGKTGKLVELAIEIQSGANIRPFIHTKVPIGKRDKLIDICFIQGDFFFVCALASKSRSSGQLIELAEIIDYVYSIKPGSIDIIPLYIVPDSNKIKNIVDDSIIFKNIQLWTVRRSSLCDTLNTWQS